MNLSLRYAMDMPHLSKEQEIQLFKQYKENNCLKSAETLILSNLRYVRKVSLSYSNKNISDEDLFQEGVIGLMKAIFNFDLNYGVRLITHAIPYIKSYILDHIIRHASIIKIATTSSHRKLFFNLHNMRGEKNQLSQDDIKRISKELNVSEYDVVDMDIRLSNKDKALDYIMEDGESLIDFIEDTRDTSYLTLKGYDEQFELIYEAIESLEEREKYIFLSRNLTEDIISLKVLANELNLSHQRVQQIEKIAMAKIKKYVLDKFKK